jgi:hypothetical protein
MPRKKASAIATASPAVTEPACPDCLGEQAVDKPKTRRRETSGQTAICLTCLGTGVAP